MNVYCEQCGNQTGASYPFRCPIDGAPMSANIDDIPEAPKGWTYYDLTITPAVANKILAEIPADSNHWLDIPRKAPGAVDYYTGIMESGAWKDQLIEHGFYEHPIRFDDNGTLTHGVMRLLACSRSGVTFRSCVLSPIWVQEKLV